MKRNKKKKKYIRKFILHQKVFDFVFEVVSGPMDGDGLVFSRFDCSTCTNSHCLGFFCCSFYLFVKKKEMAYVNCNEETLTLTKCEVEAHDKIYNTHTV